MFVGLRYPVGTVAAALMACSVVLAVRAARVNRSEELPTVAIPRPEDE